jgi:lipoprotein NlpD
MVAVALLLAACASHRPAPVEDRAARPEPPPGAVSATPPIAGTADAAVAPPAPVPTYTVKRGDTLHQIALDTGLDYRELAAWNNIENANVIRVGQVLRLTAPGSENAVSPAVAQDSPTGVTTAPLRAPPAVVAAAPATSTAPAAARSVVAGAPPPPSSATNLKTSPKALKEPYSDQAVRDLSLAASAVPAPPQALAMNAPSGPPGAAPKAESKTPAPPPAATAGDGDALDWAWPAKGKVVSGARRSPSDR